MNTSKNPNNVSLSKSKEAGNKKTDSKPKVSSNSLSFKNSNLIIDLILENVLGVIKLDIYLMIVLNVVISQFKKPRCVGG